MKQRLQPAPARRSDDKFNKSTSLVFLVALRLIAIVIVIVIKFTISTRNT